MEIFGLLDFEHFLILSMIVIFNLSRLTSHSSSPCSNQSVLMKGGFLSRHKCFDNLIFAICDEVDILIRAVGRSENPGVPVVMWGHNLPP